jgi:hypothetical protein
LGSRAAYFGKRKQMDINVSIITDIVVAIGTALTGIAAIFGIYKYISSVSVRNETIYGDEAIERYKHIKPRLYSKSAHKLKTLPYGGDDNKLTIPRLEIRKISNYSKTIGKEWKGKKALVKFYKRKNENTDDKTIIIKRWLI